MVYPKAIVILNNLVGGWQNEGRKLQTNNDNIYQSSCEWYVSQIVVNA